MASGIFAILDDIAITPIQANDAVCRWLPLELRQRYGGNDRSDGQVSFVCVAIKKPALRRVFLLRGGLMPSLQAFWIFSFSLP